MTDGPSGVPDAVRTTLDDFQARLPVPLRLWQLENGAPVRMVYPAPGEGSPCAPLAPVPSHVAATLGVEVQSEGSVWGASATEIAELIARQVAHALEYDREVRFFTYELSERYEEINLLYSISETLGSILSLEDAARAILGEVCDVLAARRGSLWVFQPESEQLNLVASVGKGGRGEPIPVSHPEAVTARVFREGRSVIFGPRNHLGGSKFDGEDRRAVTRGPETVLSVPIRYTPPSGVPRSVGVINLMGRRSGERFTASDQKLLAAIASQIGAALENNRLVRKTLEQERVARELELAHDLQMKLLPSVDGFEGAEVAARVQPADSVGGDFYQIFKLAQGRMGVMIGDVSSHGFPAALIMTLSMSAAAIYGSEGRRPAEVLNRLDAALRDELESTEMYLTLFYGVLDPKAGSLTFANAGHPHAFALRADGAAERLKATAPPVGIAEPGGYEEETVEWSSGQDMLLLFTDGLSDPLAHGTGETGESRLVAEVAARADLPLEDVVDHLFALSEDAESGIPSDDRTVMLVRV